MFGGDIDCEKTFPWLKTPENIPTLLDRNLWIKACADVQAKDGNPANRDEVRAYYDSTRDIEAYKHG